MEPDQRIEIDKWNEVAWMSRYTDLNIARSSAEKALKLSGEIGYIRGKASARLNLAINHFLRSENKPALELCHQALEYFRHHPQETGYPATLTIIANIHESFGDYDTALEKCQMAIKAAEVISYTEGIGEAKSMLGLIFSRISDHDRALKAYQEGLEIRRKMGDQRAVASSLNRIARTHTLQKQFDQALQYYDESLTIRKALNQPSVIFWTYLGLGSTYEEMDELERAREYYEKILKGFEERADDRCLLQAQLGLGRVFHKLDRTEQSKQYLEMALGLAEKLNAKPLITEAHRELAYHHENLKEFGEALFHYRKYRRIQEEIMNDESRIRLKNRQISFEIEKSEKEKEIFHLKNVQLKAAFDEISRKNRHITESIQYASRIQEALLQDKKDLGSFFRDHFILFLPRDLVSGDFYWSEAIEGKALVAAVDCTGHGVPGALMSMLGIVFLNKIILEKRQTEPGRILDELREEVIRALGQTGDREESKDGMDLSLCAYNPAGGVLEFAGANNSLFLIRDGILQEYRVDKMPIGFQESIHLPFRTQTIQLQKEDIWYQFTDGFADQVGGPDKKRYRSKQLKHLLTEIHGESMGRQREILTREFHQWKGEVEQYDDVLVIGVKV